MICEFCGKREAYKAVWDGTMYPACDECFVENDKEVELEEEDVF